MPDTHKDQPTHCRDKDELALDALAVPGQQPACFCFDWTALVLHLKACLFSCFHRRFVYSYIAEVYSIRLLCGDMVDRASSGHLGTPFGCAPLANALWGNFCST